jgi:hypothetical protein
MKRRDFLSMTIGGAAFSGVRPLFARARQTGPIGANNRIRTAIIGCGGRGNAVSREWQAHTDAVFVAACDVDDMRTANATNTLAGRQSGAKVDAIGDYRRILDRNDVDALLIATPDHWHSQICIDAMSAGKDMYCEKPVSNSVEAAVKMRDAARKSNRIVQIGTQQRSWTHFIEAAKLFQDGYIGSVRHVVMSPPGGGGGGGGGPVQGLLASQMPAEPIPPGFNWDMFQGPAERRPYLSARDRLGRASGGRHGLADEARHQAPEPHERVRAIHRPGEGPRENAEHLRDHLAVRRVHRDAVECRDSGCRAPGRELRRLVLWQPRCAVAEPPRL